MKLAPVSTGLALLLLAFGMAISKPTTSPDRIVPIDVTGVDTLRVFDVGDRVRINISDDVPSRASFDDLKSNTVSVKRKGRTVSVVSNLHGYDELEVTVPASIRHFIVGSANLQAGKALAGEVTVHASKSIHWTGDVESLRIGEVPPRRACKRDCGIEATIADGQIGQVTVIAPRAHVQFLNSDTVGAGDLYLGPDGKLSLNRVKRLGHIVLHDTEPALSK